jgi:hypothetical protein
LLLALPAIYRDIGRPRLSSEDMNTVRRFSDSVTQIYRRFCCFCEFKMENYAEQSGQITITSLIYKFALIIMVSLGVCAGSAYGDQQDSTLKGTVEENEAAATRLHRFELSKQSDDDKQPATRIHPHRLTKPDAQTNPQLAQLDPQSFNTRQHDDYDLEAESNSRELMLAWELWHKQLTKAVYERTPPIGTGWCAYRIKVTHDNRLTIDILKSGGNPAISAHLVAGAMSLDGNIGLSFPEGSRRQAAYDSHIYMSGPNITPGYNWDKNDFEKIHETW